MDLRKQFEQWYADNAFDFESNPIGSRECGLQWAAFEAGRAAALQAAMSICNDAADEYDATHENGRALAATRCMADIQRAIKGSQ